MAARTTAPEQQGTAVFSVRIPRDLVEQIDDIANNEDRSRNYMLVSLLRRALTLY